MSRCLDKTGGIKMKDYRLEKLANVLVNYSTKVKPGDNVCVSGEESALPFIKEVTKAGSFSRRKCEMVC